MSGALQKGPLAHLLSGFHRSHSLGPCRNASREDNLGVVGSVRRNLSSEKLWEGEERCGCGRLWPEMLYCRPHLPSYTFFFLI